MRNSVYQGRTFLMTSISAFPWAPDDLSLGGCFPASIVCLVWNNTFWTRHFGEAERNECLKKVRRKG